MSVDLDNKQLQVLRMRLKSGEYDGVHLMKAWLAIDELIEARDEIELLKTGLNEAMEWNWLDEDSPKWLREKLEARAK